MDRNQRSRRQKSGAGSSSAHPPRRSMSSRVGLQKAGKPTPKQRSANTEQQTRRAPNRTSPRPQQINPQKNGYDSNAPKRQRRVTQAEIRRRERNRRVIGLFAVLAVLIIGAVISVNLLFKVTVFRVENFDRTTPADTGIYSADEIVAALGIEKNSSLFGFSTEEKTQLLAAQFPYLDDVQVDVQLPATVVIKVRPATERFACMYSGGWMILSDSLRILRLEVDRPAELTVLSATIESDISPQVGQTITPQTYNSLLKDETATAETAQTTAGEILAQLRDELQTYGLYDNMTELDIRDISKLAFTYQGRVTVELGNASGLDYKMRMAATILTDPDKGLTASDKGTLDVSAQREDGEVRGYFQPYEQPTPTPEPTPEPETEAAETTAE